MSNKQQLEEFIVGYMDNARKLAAIYIKNREDLDDVVSASVEKALKNADNLKAPEAMKVWFNKILINTAINHLRNQSKRKTRVEKTAEYYYDDFSQLEFEELLDILPEKDRHILYLRFRDKYELHEIAAELEMNENTVKTRLYRSLKKLKLKLTDDNKAVKADARKPVAGRIAMFCFWVLLSATIVFNAIPSLAVAAYDVPIIGDIIKVITFNRFEYAVEGYTAEVNLPEIQGLLDTELQERLNAEFMEHADNLIRSFEASVIELEELNLEEVDGRPARMSIKGDYMIKTDNEQVLSIDAYIYSEVTNFVLHKFCTIDKRTGTEVTLAGLFAPNADYVTPVSAYIIEEMLRLNAEEGTAFEVGDTAFTLFTAIRHDHSFYISDDSDLVICFDKYEVAAGFQGSPEFIIPKEVIKDITVSDLIK